MAYSKTVYLTAEPQEYLSGNGTFWNPHDASDRDKFDALMSGFSENTIIYLLPGTYLTRGRSSDSVSIPGEFIPKSGWRVYGAGIGQSIIKLDIRPEDNRQDSLLYGVFITQWEENHGDIEISDITFNLNLSNINLNIAVSAIGLIGGNIRINNCEIIDWGNKSSDFETFIFSLSAYRGYQELGATKISERSIIENNIIHKPIIETISQGACSAVIIGGGLFGEFPNTVIARNDVAIIRNNTLDGTVSGNINLAGQTSIGLASMDTNQALFHNNTVKNFRFGLYTDTWQCERHYILNNFFKNTAAGIFYNCGNFFSGYSGYAGGLVQESFTKIKQSIIKGNKFLLKKPLAVEEPYGIRIKSDKIGHFQKGSNNIFGWTCEKLIAQNNTFTWSNKKEIPIGTLRYAAINIQNTSGAYITNNYFDLPHRGTLVSTTGNIFIDSKIQGSGVSGLYCRNNNCGIWDWEWYIASGAGKTLSDTTAYWNKTGNYVLPFNPM
ncbi:MAG: hypothetical protein AABY22_25505 [Nanoarchaeota archaeon]